jgi:hypothetical protein
MVIYKLMRKAHLCINIDNVAGKVGTPWRWPCVMGIHIGVNFMIYDMIRYYIWTNTISWKEIHLYIFIAWQMYKITNLMFCWPCIIIYRCNRINKMHCLLSVIMINSLYMFRAPVCSSSGGTVYTTIGIFCVYYVSWLLVGLGWNWIDLITLV